MCANNIFKHKKAAQFKKRNTFYFIVSAKEGIRIHKNRYLFILQMGLVQENTAVNEVQLQFIIYIVHHIVLLILKTYFHAKSRITILNHIAVFCNTLLVVVYYFGYFNIFRAIFS